MRIRKHPYLLETIWMDKCKFDEAERLFHESQEASVAASTMSRAAQEAELARAAWPLAGEEVQQEREVGKRRRRKRSPRAQLAWSDWHSGEEVDCTHQVEMAGLPMVLGSALVKATPHPAADTKLASRDSAPGCGTRPLVACHHLVHGVWVNKDAFDEAERLFIVRSQARGIPRSLSIPAPRVTAVLKPRATPDEGYISATPATPITPGFPSGVGASPPVNGMFPSASWHPLAHVWLEKPLYDDAERLYHEMLHGGPAAGTESKGTPLSTGQRPPSTSLAHTRQSAKPCLPPTVGKDPAAAALHLVDEGSESVWFSKPTYDAAELRYHLAGIGRAANKTQELTSDPLQVSLPERPPSAPCCLSLQDKTMAVNFLTEEKIWFDKYKYDDAEMQYYIRMNRPATTEIQNSPAVQENGASNILRDIARARENIQKSLAGSAVQGADVELCARVTSLEKENQNLHQVVEDLRLALAKLEARLSTVEKSSPITKPAVCPPAPQNKPAPKKPEEEDDDIDLFGSSDEDESAEQERIREERLRQYAAKKSKKPAVIAKSSILLDVKPWDDETDMVKLEECVRTVQIDGLLWGASKLAPVGYGIKKLQIQCVVEDDKVGTDQLEEEITKFEDYVQSVDVAAFNKI